MDTSFLDTKSNCKALPSETFCRPLWAVILFSYLCAQRMWLWGKTDESLWSTSYKLNSYTTLVKNTILYCGLCLFWDHHRRNCIVWNHTKFPKRKLTESNVCTWVPVHDVAMPIQLCWFLQLYNSSKFAAPHVTISVNRITLVIFEWRLTSVFPKSCFLAHNLRQKPFRDQCDKVQLNTQHFCCSWWRENIITSVVDLFHLTQWLSWSTLTTGLCKCFKIIQANVFPVTLKRE